MSKLLLILFSSVFIFAMSFDDFQKDCLSTDYAQGISDKHKNLSEGIRKAQLRAVRSLLEITNGALINAQTLEKEIYSTLQEQDANEEEVQEYLNEFLDQLESNARGIIRFTYVRFDNGDDYRHQNGIVTARAKPRCEKYDYNNFKNLFDAFTIKIKQDKQ